MSHELSIVNGRAELVLSKKPAWHGLGTVVLEEMTIADAIAASQLDWEVKKDLALPSGCADSIANKSCFVTYRADTGKVLGTVGSVYKVIQNVEAFSFLESMHQDGTLYVETMGALRCGEVVWALVRFPDFEYVGKDVHASYIMLRLSHDGMGSMLMQETDVRVVCANTMRMAINGGNEKRLKIAHRGNITDKLEAAREMFGFAKEARERHYAILNKLAQRYASTADIDKYIEGLFPDPIRPAAYDSEAKRLHEHRCEMVRLRRGEVMQNFQMPDSPDASETWYGAVNAVTQYVDHRKHTGNPERFFEATQFGSGAELKERALLDAQVLSDLKI